jgi:hypothetical protein
METMGGIEWQRSDTTINASGFICILLEDRCDIEIHNKMFRGLSVTLTPLAISSHPVVSSAYGVYDFALKGSSRTLIWPFLYGLIVTAIISLLQEKQYRNRHPSDLLPTSFVFSSNTTTVLHYLSRASLISKFINSR